MGNAIVITGGEMPPFSAVKHLFCGADLVIACDGGMDWAKENGILPHVMIGDMDSVNAASHDHFIAAGVEEILLQPEKDDTDTEAGVNLALTRGADAIAIVGGTGKRLDHTIANLHVLYGLYQKGVDAVLYGAMESVRCIDGEYTIKDAVGQTVSVLPVFTGCELSLTGFHYPLSHYRYPMGTTVGISNVVTTNCAKITIHSGCAFVFQNYMAD